MKHRILLASLFLLVIPFASAQTQTYTITDLGQLAPTAINSWGEVAGNQNGHGFVWARGWGKHDLGLLPGGTFSSAAAVNDSGVVTGTADGPGTLVVPDGSPIPCSDVTQPFVWSPRNGMQGLGIILPGGSVVGAEGCGIPFYSMAINDHNEVGGLSGIFDRNYQVAFLWAKVNGMSLVGGNWPTTFINKISNTGQYVGENSTDVNEGFGQAWASGTSLGTFDGGADSEYSSAALGVNDRGQIVGWYTTGPIYYGACEGYSTDMCPMHAVSWTKTGVISDLGTLPGDSLSMAMKVNLFGQVIGASGNSFVYDYEGDGLPQLIGHPFIWTKNNGMQDLNTLIPAGGWVLNSVSDINVWGQIVGSGTLNGESHGFLLTPQ